MYRIQGGDQKEYGPITGDQVKQWISDKRLNRFSLCAGDDGIWKPLGQFPEFTEALGASLTAASTGIGGSSLGRTDGIGSGTGRAAALRQVRTPGLAMILVGGLLIAVSLLVYLVWISGKFAVFQRPVGLNPQMSQLWENQVRAFAKSGWRNALFDLLVGGGSVFAGFRLRQLRSYGLVTGAAILMLLPCTSCCCVSLPLAVWVLILANRSDVKPFFE